MTEQMVKLGNNREVSGFFPI